MFRSNYSIYVEDIDLFTMFGDNPRIFKSQQEKTGQIMCIQWRHISTWAFAQFLQSGQSFPCCPHEETLGLRTHCDFAKFLREFSLTFAVEKTLGERSDFYFSPRNIFFAQGVFHGEMQKELFSLTDL